MATAPQAAMEMPQEAGANPFADPNTMAVYDQMRQTVSPKEFGDQMLEGAAQTAPEEVAAFRSALEQIEMPPEALDLLNNMVDEILANPEQYDQIRAKYKEMGAPDEILPEQFDPQFFAALNMAVDQMIGAPSGEQAFAKGGIAELSPVSKAIADYGRNGDTMLAHITPAEARMLRRKGGSGTINPKTGLPEFFNLFKEIGNAFKSVGKAVKSFAKSTVGKIVLTVALGFFLGPAAASFMSITSAAGVAAVSGFVGSAGSTLLAGGNIGQALKAGAIGGLTAGATAGATGAFSGTDAFASGSYSGAGLTPTEALQGQADKFTGMFKSPPFPQYTAQGALTDNITTNATRDAYAGELYKTNPEAFYNPPAEPTIAADSAMPKKVTLGGGPVTQSVTPGGATVTQNTTGFDYTENNPLLTPEQRTAGLSADPTRTFGAAPSASATTAATGNTIAPPIQQTPTIGTGPYNTPGVLDSASQAGKGILQMLPGTEGTFSEGFENFTKGAGDLLSPGPTSEQVTARARDILGSDTTGKMTYADALKAAKTEGPGFFRSYAPATALGIGAIGAFGGFSPSSVPESGMRKTLMGGPGSAQDLLKNDPRRFYIQGLPGVQYYSGSVMRPPGMATGGEVKHFVDGGATDQQVADWWAANSDKGYSDAYIADLMDQFQVTPEQFARSIGANTETAADIASRYAAVPETRTIQDDTGYNSQTVTLTRQSDGTYLGNNGQLYNADGTQYIAPPVTITTTNGGGGTTTDGGGTTVTDGGGGTTTVTDGGGTTRSAADQAIWNYFANNTNLTDAQIVAAMNANKWNINDIARVTGTTANLADFNRRIAAVNAANSTNTNTSTGTGTGTGTGISVSTNTSIIRTTNTNTSTRTSTSTSTSTSTGTGSLTSITAPWFINPQTFAQGTAGVTVPSSTLRPAGLPTDALSRAIQGDLQAAGPTASDATMQQFMDKQGYDPRQVAYAINAGVPEIQNRYYAAKNAGILGATAPATTITQPFNNTGGITQLMSPTGPLGEFSTRTVTPVTSVLPVTPAAATLPNVSFNRTDIQQRMPNLQMGNAGTPLSVLAGQPSTYGVTGYTDAYSPFANQAPGAKLMNMGGIAGLAKGGYPRKTGQIDGPGTATSDSIPAMLSDGEFVMTAKAVRGAGKGDRRAGAKRMYALMHQLEQNAARG
jgi:hypothetical protein